MTYRLVNIVDAIISKFLDMKAAVLLKDLSEEEKQLVQDVLLSSVCKYMSPNFLMFFSCDQAAQQMVFSVCLSVCLSVRLSVCLSHLFHHVPIIVSS